MKLRVVLIAVLVLGLTPSLVSGEESQEPKCDLEWRTIDVRAVYAEGGLMIDEEVHDVGVSGPLDEVFWRLECVGCPEGTVWQITELQMMADMHKLTRVVSEIFMDGGSTVTLERKELGLESPGQGRSKAHEAFTLVEPGWDEWAPMGSQISAESRRTEDKSNQDELWKFSVEIRAPGFDEGMSCEDDRMRACWDPHKYTHPGRKR